MSDLPTRDGLVKALRSAFGIRANFANEILDVILPLVMRGPVEAAIDPVTRLAIVCGNADWDGQRICPTCDGKGYVNGR